MVSKLNISPCRFSLVLVSDRNALAGVEAIDNGFGESKLFSTRILGVLAVAVLPEHDTNPNSVGGVKECTTRETFATRKTRSRDNMQWSLFMLLFPVSCRNRTMALVGQHQHQHQPHDNTSIKQWEMRLR